ncbi:HD domain-containing protein [Mucilaginibacter rubeus]|uniref:HD domain-containing protein n=1 Tax=Mucilaginibacter rubeus TaxID=2027860 RepID=A0AAE6JBK8_9SPHI|nr:MULTISPECIES: HD domain-containing protein [Mucilaginibacter]QEM02070.1 HD domain-containing protein [Mucilaginibacter rubeus]QEM14697.1 HD domain-containing protein [Mucilaginibacter gossypii]QTE42596.1 HD domain-containing protein [Mucilaginibacter rubeus]QTE49197.1 HD domain-containing protein [Mucilaginibacter rubeus]QTE54295.1 HD domain-containing protein [Mucilaginibacter rubeus]
MQQHLRHPVFSVISHLAGEQNVQAFAIGGFVRDIFLNRPSKDIDIVIIGNGIAFAEVVANTLKVKLAVYKNFGTASLKYRDLEIEFVGARKESYRRDSRKPIVENGTLEDDQKRRDFTINALAISLHPDTFGELLDPFNGIADLENKLIRTPLNPNETFSDDPLRMMRAIRFATQLNFRIDDIAVEAIKTTADRISIISQERITDELNKIILSPVPSIGFNYLFDTGLLHKIFPQMVALYGVDYVDGKGHKDNFYHTLQVLDNICETTDDLWLRWAAILHDIAKPATKRFEPSHGWTFHGHEDRGARMVPKIFTQLKLPLNEKMKQVQKLVQLHLRPIVLSQSIVTDSAVRRLLFEAGDDIEALMLLCKADITTKNEYKVKKYRNNFELVQQKLRDVEERDSIRNWQPPVTGNDIMTIFGIKEGREVGIIKNQIREAILEGEIPNNREAALTFTISKGIEIGLKVVTTPN